MKVYRTMVLISNGDSSKLKGSEAVIAAFHQAIEKYDLGSEVHLTTIPDSSSAKSQPLVIIYPEAVAYGPISEEDVDFLVSEHLYKGRVAPTLKVSDPFEMKRISWLLQRTGTMPAEKRIVLEHVGVIDPTSINDFLTHDGGQAFATAMEMEPQKIIDIIKKSGLRGRGGAGFSAGIKWQAVRDAPGDKKYIVCNADESEPGTFKDRVILEGNPFSMIEAMLIAGYACGADEGYIYIRGEYHDALEKITNAIQASREFGVLGKNILNTGFDFDIHVHSGAGAYICGEETALLE